VLVSPSNITSLRLLGHENSSGEGNYLNTMHADWLDVVSSSLTLESPFDRIACKVESWLPQLMQGD
jgi:hypothetical protein